jgi:peptidoglycan-associated lipoprotein
MSMLKLNSNGLGVLAVLAVAGSMGACKTVSPDEMDAGLASLRAELQEEMNAGDERVASDLGGRLDGVESRMAQLEADLQQMEQDFEVAITRLEDQLRFNVPVYFAFDDATLQMDDHAILDRFGEVAQEYYPSAMITVEGFTDPAGGEAYNISLGQRRADAVRTYLGFNTPLSVDRVRAVSYGENTQRLVTPDGRGPGTNGWQNRRVVLVIDHDGQPPNAMSTISDEGSTQ